MKTVQTDLEPAPLAVATREAQPLALTSKKAEPSIYDLIAAVVQAGNFTPESAAVIEKLAPVMVAERKWNAEQEFARDFIALQLEIPQIKATKPIMASEAKGGGLRFKVAQFEDIDAQAKPICLRHGFTYSFKEGPANQGRISKICTITHKGGHSREHPFSVRIGSGPPGSSESQADMSAHSFCKRGSLCDALAIAIDHLDQIGDGNAGATITAEQAASLRERVQATGSDEARFLKFAASSTYEAIAANRYIELDAMLRKREKTT